MSGRATVPVSSYISAAFAMTDRVEYARRDDR